MTECFFGNKDIFAAEARPGEDPNWKAFCYFRVWVGGVYIGDFDDIAVITSVSRYTDLLETHPRLEVDDNVWLLDFPEVEVIFDDIYHGEFLKNVKVIELGRYGEGRVMPGEAFDYCSQLAYLDSDDYVNFVWFAQEYWFDQDPDYPRGMVHKKVNIDYFDKVMKEFGAYLLKSDDFLYSV